MNEQAVSASEVRDRFADYLEEVETRRVLVQKHGHPRAYLISVRELHALEETLAILEDTELLESIQAGLRDIEAGRVRDARDVFTDLDAELSEET